MKFPKTFHLPDPVKEKLKQLSVFIGDKAEVFNKNWCMGQITFERAHLICVTFVLICILLGTYGMLRPEELYRDSIYRQQVLILALGPMAVMVVLVILVVIMDKLGRCFDRDDRELICSVLNYLVSLACLFAIILRTIKTEQEQEPTRNEAIVFWSSLIALIVITFIVELFTEKHFEKEKLKKGYKLRYEMVHRVGPVKLYELV